jgi:hypothetical protein
MDNRIDFPKHMFEPVFDCACAVQLEQMEMIQFDNDGYGKSFCMFVSV